MKTNYGTRPESVRVDRVGQGAIVRLRENIIDLSTAEYPQWQADEYTLETHYSATLESRVKADFDGWLQLAKQEIPARPTQDERLTTVEITQGEIFDTLATALGVTI